MWDADGSAAVATVLESASTFQTYVAATFVPQHRMARTCLARQCAADARALLLGDELHFHEPRQLLVGIGDLAQGLLGDLIGAHFRVAACLRRAPSPVRCLVPVGGRCNSHAGQTSDADTKFHSVNAVFSDVPQSF